MTKVNNYVTMSCILIVVLCIVCTQSYTSYGEENYSSSVNLRIILKEIFSLLRKWYRRNGREGGREGEREDRLYNHTTIVPFL